jgi:hypothetical protein
MSSGVPPVYSEVRVVLQYTTGAGTAKSSGVPPIYCEVRVVLQYTTGAGTDKFSGVPPVYSEVRVVRSLVFFVVFCRSLLSFILTARLSSSCSRRVL